MLAYPQANIEIPLYTKMPAGINVKNKTRKQNAVKLRKNVYGKSKLEESDSIILRQN